MAFSASSNSKSWGLTVPGRPPTPSDGAAQQYSRFGPYGGQRLATFANGTCLEYGPDDLIDEFDLNTHPFGNQVALVDSAIKDIRAVRQRYREARSGIQCNVSASGQSSDADSESSLPEKDPYNDFRIGTADQTMVQHIKLESGTYMQVPSRYGTVTNMVSIYSHPNKSDVPGLGHPGLIDSRFGRSGRLEAQQPHQMVDDMTKHGGGGHHQLRRARRRHRPRNFPPYTDGNDSEEEGGSAPWAHNPNKFRTRRPGNSNFGHHYHSRNSSAGPSNQHNNFHRWQPGTNNGRRDNPNNRGVGPSNQPYSSLQMSSNSRYYSSSNGNAGPTYRPNRYTSEVRNVAPVCHPSSSQQRPAHQPNGYPPIPRNPYPPYQPSGSQPVPGTTVYYNTFGNLIYVNNDHNIPQYNVRRRLHGTDDGSGIGERARNSALPQPTITQAQGLQVQRLREHANSRASSVPVSQPNPPNSYTQSGTAGATISRHPSPPDLSTALNRLDDNLQSEDNWDYFRSVADHYSTEYFETLNQDTSATSEALPSLPSRETTGPPPPLSVDRQISTSPSSAEDEQGPPTPPPLMPLLEFNRAWEQEFGHQRADLSHHQHTPRAFQDHFANGNGIVEVPRTTPTTRTPEPSQLTDGRIADPRSVWLLGPEGMNARGPRPEQFGFPPSLTDGVGNPRGHWDAEDFEPPRGFQFPGGGGHSGGVRIVDHSAAGGRLEDVPGWINTPGLEDAMLQGPLPPPPSVHDPNWTRAVYLGPPGHPLWRPGGWPMAVNQPPLSTHTYNQLHQHDSQSGYASTQPSVPFAREGSRNRAPGRLVLRSPNHPVRRITLRSPIAFNTTASFPHNMNMPFEAFASNQQLDMGPQAARADDRVGTLSSWPAPAGFSGDNNCGMHPANSIFGEEPGMISQPVSPTLQRAHAARARRQRLYERSRASTPATGPSHARGTPITARRPASSSDARQG